MVIPLGTDQLDVGGAATAGVFNGFARGLDFRTVADKASHPPGYGFDKLLVRTALLESGRFKSPADLKGLTVGENATVMSPAMYELLKKYGLTASNIHWVNLNYSEQIAALRNGKVNVTITTEAIIAQQMGIARSAMGGDSWYPNQEIAVVIYGGGFIGRWGDVALRFMRAYLRGARFYVARSKTGNSPIPTRRR